MGMMRFGALACLTCVQSVPALLRRVAEFLASYSYSLYLIHNTVLIVALEWLDFEQLWLEIAVGVILAHATAFGLYMAFERHYRTVARWLRPRFEREMTPHSIAAAAQTQNVDAPAAGLTAKES
jgi:peptidoglycan/LPS O-acetylase OafA/YrhL